MLYIVFTNCAVYLPRDAQQNMPISCQIIVLCIFYVFFFCSNYGSGYDTLGQQGNKDFTNSYSSNGQSKSTGGSAGAGSGKGEVPLCT